MEPLSKSSSSNHSHNKGWSNSVEFRYTVYFTVFSACAFLYTVYGIAKFYLSRHEFGLRNRKVNLTLMSTIASSFYIASCVWSLWYQLFDEWQHRSWQHRLKTVLYSTVTSASVFVCSGALAVRIWLVFFDAKLAMAHGDSAWISLVTEPPSVTEPRLDRAYALLKKKKRDRRLRTRTRESSLIYMRRHSRTTAIDGAFALTQDATHKLSASQTFSFKNAPTPVAYSTPSLCGIPEHRVTDDGKEKEHGTTIGGSNLDLVDRFGDDDGGSQKMGPAKDILSASPMQSMLTPEYGSATVVMTGTSEVELMSLSAVTEEDTDADAEDMGDKDISEEPLEAPQTVLFKSLSQSKSTDSGGSEEPHTSILDLDAVSVLDLGTEEKEVGSSVSNAAATAEVEAFDYSALSAMAMSALKLQTSLSSNVDASIVEASAAEKRPSTTSPRERFGFGMLQQMAKMGSNVSLRDTLRLTVDATNNSPRHLPPLDETQVSIHKSADTSATTKSGHAQGTGIFEMKMEEEKGSGQGMADGCEMEIERVNSADFITSEYRWFFERKATIGQATFVSLRVTLLVFVGWLLCTLLAAFKASEKMVSIVYCIWLGTFFCAVCEIARRYPHFDDALKIHSELKLMTSLLIVFFAGYLALVILEYTHVGTRYGFWYWLIRNWFTVVFTAILTLIQTQWVLYNFNNDNSVFGARRRTCDGWCQTQCCKVLALLCVTLVTRSEDDDDDSMTMGLVADDSVDDIGTLEPVGKRMHDQENMQTPSVGFTVPLTGVSATISPLMIEPHKDEVISSTAVAAETKGTGDGVVVDSDTDTAKMDDSSVGIMGLKMRSFTEGASRLMRYITASQTSLISVMSQFTDMTQHQQLLVILANENTFRLFMKHQFKEFSYESMLCVFEMMQFRRLLLADPCAISDELAFAQMDGGVFDAKTRKAAKSVEDYFSAVVFPPTVEREVVSAIVCHKLLSNEQKFLALVDKYVLDSAELCVNISSRCRREVLALADTIIDDFAFAQKSHILGPIIKVNHTVFDKVLKQLLNLMVDSLHRFRNTAAFLAVSHHIAKEVCE